MLIIQNHCAFQQITTLSWTKMRQNETKQPIQFTHQQLIHELRLFETKVAKWKICILSWCCTGNLGSCSKWATQISVKHLYQPYIQQYHKASTTIVCDYIFVGKGMKFQSGCLPYQWQAYRFPLTKQSSAKSPVSSGVPQGTVLGPPSILGLYNRPSWLHFWRLPCSTICWRKCYLSCHKQQLQQDLNAMQEWERKWLMEFHPAKCQLLRITKRRKPLKFSYSIHDHPLEAVSSAKYLGVELTDSLSWNRHVETTSKMCKKSLGFLRCNMNNCPRELRAAATPPSFALSLSMPAAHGILPPKRTSQRSNLFNVVLLGTLWTTTPEIVVSAPCTVTWVGSLYNIGEPSPKFQWCTGLSTNSLTSPTTS